MLFLLIMKLNKTLINSYKPRSTLYRKLDGHGLYIEIAKSGTKTWIHRYSFESRPTMRILGHYPDISIAKARELLHEDKKLLRQKINPMVNSHNPNLPLNNHSSFKEVFDEWYELKVDTWDKEYAKDVKERAVSYLFPDLGARVLGEIKTKEIIMTLKKMEKKGVLNTLSKVKSIATRVFTYGVGLGICEYNPARDVPMDIFKRAKKVHYAHITDPREFREVLKKLSVAGDKLSISYETYMALNLLPHVFLRVAELTDLSWKEVDFENRLIRIHPERMKMRREHIVPMSRYVEEKLKNLYEYSGKGDWVFPSPAINVDKPITSNTLLQTLRKLGIKKDEMSLHGFRHSASTMLNEMDFPSHVIELQLSHADKNSSRSTYNKATFLEARREMMEKWSRYLLNLITK